MTFERCFSYVIVDTVHFLKRLKNDRERQEKLAKARLQARRNRREQAKSAREGKEDLEDINDPAKLQVWWNIDLNSRSFFKLFIILFRSTSQNKVHKHFFHPFCSQTLRLKFFFSFLCLSHAIDRIPARLIFSNFHFFFNSSTKTCWMDFRTFF